MRFKTMFTSGLLAFGLLASPITQPAASATEFSTDQKAEIEKIMVDYLLENPDVIRKVFGLLREQDAKREQAAATERAEKAKLVLASKKTEIFNSDLDPVVGNANGDVTMVEFLDYNCGYCKRAFSNMLTLMEKDQNLRIVIKEWPVLGPQSVEASLVAVAVQKTDPSKYWDFHKGMMTLRGQANKETALRVAEKIGLDRAKLETMMDDKETLKPIEASYALADELGLTGTPAYVVGEELIPGFVPVTTLETMIEVARKKSS
ncbi:DsbA family protein [Cohaesibacter gelatinilyticus]|uniref:Protein-disulfide isomerase n=1 Tax=Cohaesibacter gelatinilyticus TaxID=372072 RepID=A0A285NEX8_9HYPH|nr:DsbA family protein [Cohaesibacter gelatinilyticus]SNZ08010.1 Protein-disulfide isomerase [Cohaesibacter gelatinilyticus]